MAWQQIGGDPILDRIESGKNRNGRGGFAYKPHNTEMKRLHFVAVAALLLSACGSPQTKQPELNLAGYPPAFRDGYTDGCNSSRRGTREIRDKSRYKADSMYAAGWRDGFDICSEKKYE